MATNRPTIFISRDLKEDSIFKELVTSKGQIIGCSLLEFSPVAFKVLPTTDWLFFYSKKGIEYCLSQLEDWSDLPPIGVIGSASADFLLTNYGLKAQFVGTGHPEKTAQQFLALAKRKVVTFVQAQNSKQSVQQLIADEIMVRNLIVYQNRIKQHFELPIADILVFTSPLNVRAYFSKYPYQKHQKIISIGKVTTKALEQQGIQQIIMATMPSEQALAMTCLQILA